MTPHHLCLTDEAVRSLDPNLKMNPPLRTAEDRSALHRGARLDGTIAAVATDHAPHSREEKDVPFEEAPFGVTGLETAFAALYTSLVEPGLSQPGDAARADVGRPGARSSGSSGRASRSARRPTSSCSASEVRWTVRADAIPLPLRELVAARRDAAAAGSC